ncbi:MAG: hypothetical protein ACREIF_05675 [Chthoniobacterales bacterium]
MVMEPLLSGALDKIPVKKESSTPRAAPDKWADLALAVSSIGQARAVGAVGNFASTNFGQNFTSIVATYCFIIRTSQTFCLLHHS